MNDGSGNQKSHEPGGDVHSSNTSEENPFCGIAIASKSFVCNPIQQFLADVLLYWVVWGPGDIEWFVADK